MPPVTAALFMMAKTKDKFRQALGAAIKKRRDELGISTYRLAEMIGSTQPRIPEIERGDVKNLDTYYACVEALGGEIKIEWDKLNP